MKDNSNRPLKPDKPNNRKWIWISLAIIGFFPLLIIGIIFILFATCIGVLMLGG